MQVTKTSQSAPAQDDKTAHAGAADSIAVTNGGLGAGNVKVRKCVKWKCSDYEPRWYGGEE